MTKAKVDECPFPKYVPLSGEAFCENLEVKYTLYHDHIPQPTIGYKAKWSEINKDVPNILADERSCPAMMRREEIGITIRMPYTATFYRDGSIEIKEFYGKEDNTTYRYHPRQGKGIVLNRSSNEEKSFAEFPACLMTLPQPIDSQASLGLFVLGDIRLNTWIIDSGVFLLDVPKDYALIITPVAHKKDIPGVVLHQGVSESVPRIMGSLKIPVKIDFSQIPDNQDSVTIPRGEPLLSWILVKLPKVSISEIKVKQDININDNTYILLSPNGLSSELQTVNDHICELTRFNKDYDLSIKLSGFENKIFVFLKNNKYSYTRINELAKKLNLTREQTISSLNKLTKLGLVSILNHIDPLPAPEIKVESWMGKSRKDAWNEIYKTGRYYRTVITSPSEEIQSLFKLLKREGLHHFL
ncbi:hypothetical protein [Geobacillus sp. C56-T2]|uniref:hypothetical protein n=1 Tax=Geobacillus sp. C56-T2 TaxID=600773 RepID=UPI0011A849DA|nr:hypothetical protein [Geobacillus sp. C56-T2]TWG24957.1 hypothetical protein GC56T2_3547 [Geobacillus sp. C56-T2]